LKIFLIAVLLVLCIPGITTTAPFREDPVLEHIRKYGAGIDMSGIWTSKKHNFELKPKNFIPANKRRKK